MNPGLVLKGPTICQVKRPDTQVNVPQMKLAVMESKLWEANAFGASNQWQAACPTLKGCKAPLEVTIAFMSEADLKGQCFNGLFR